MLYFILGNFMLDLLFNKAATLSISLPYWQVVNERRINAKRLKILVKVE